MINAVSSRHHLNKPNRLCQEILLWIPAAIAHWKYLVAVLRRRDHPAIALRGDQKLSERMIAYIAAAAREMQRILNSPQNYPIQTGTGISSRP